MWSKPTAQMCQEVAQVLEKSPQFVGVVVELIESSMVELALLEQGARLIQGCIVQASAQGRYDVCKNLASRVFSKVVNLAHSPNGSFVLAQARLKPNVLS